MGNNNLYFHFKVFFAELFFVIFLNKKRISMNSLTKYLFNNFCSKHLSVYKFIFNEIRFTSVQYYGFVNNSSNRQSEVFKPKNLKMCNVSTLFNFKQSWSIVNSKIKELLRNTLLSPKQKHIGYLWYRTLEAINVKEFITLLEISDTFYSRFKVMELHVWMLLYHLPQENRLHSLVRYGLMEAMWLDTECRAKITEKYNLKFKQNMRTFYKKFKVTLLLYDEGFYGNDMALSNALWFAFFDRSNVDPRILESLVYYVRNQMNHLNKLHLETPEKVKEDKIWLPLEPHVKEIFNRS